MRRHFYSYRYAGVNNSNNVVNGGQRSAGERSTLSRVQVRLRNRYATNSLRENRPSDQVGGNILTEPFKRAFYAFRGPRITKAPPNVRRILRKHGNKKILALTVSRKPIFSFISRALNTLSLGAFNKAIRKKGYDDMFHLWINIKLEGKPEILRMEKNQTIVVSKTNKIEGHSVPVNLQGKSITLHDLFFNAEKLQGAKEFYRYRSNGGNCQNFVDHLLRGSELLTTNLHTFILQDAKYVFSKMPRFIEFLANRVTDFAGSLDIIQHGFGKITI